MFGFKELKRWYQNDTSVLEKSGINIMILLVIFGLILTGHCKIV
jgi:hypothetical protein